MNQYGATAQKHWAKWLPSRYASIENPETFFADLGEQIAEQVHELARALAGDDPPNEGYLEHLGRLNMARFNAEGQVLREMALLEPEPGADEDEEENEDQDPSQRWYDPNDERFLEEDRERELERAQEAKEDED